MTERGNEPSLDYLISLYGCRLDQEQPLPKRNYGFEKRQKEIRRQLKKEEKKQKKLDRAKQPAEPRPDEPDRLAPPKS